MEENKDFKAEEITKENQSAVEENELVTEDTEATSKEEAEEIVEEYTENDDLALIGKMKDENKKRKFCSAPAQMGGKGQRISNCVCYLCFFRWVIGDWPLYRHL